MTGPVLEAVDLKVGRGDLQAVRGISLSIGAGERVGLVGESGSGKSMTALALMGLLPQGWSAQGEVHHDGVDLLTIPERDLAARRGKTLSMIFQDPMAALNPVRRVGRQVSDVLLRHGEKSRKKADERTLELFKEMRLPRPEKLMEAYPHQLSGGQRQRVMIATAVACSPSLIIADEPTTALDVTVQKEVLRLLDKTVDEYNSALLLITHSLPVVAAMCDKVAVMYGGSLMEFGDVQDVLARPRHPYTEALLKSQPELDTANFHSAARLPHIPGSVPSLMEMPDGCPFANRCERAEDKCSAKPELVADGATKVACWFPVERERGRAHAE